MAYDDSFPCPGDSLPTLTHINCGDVTLKYDSLAPKKTLLLGNVNGCPLELQPNKPSHSPNDPISTLEPLLISSVTILSSSQRESSVDQHTMAVVQVIDALVYSSTRKQNMSESSSEYLHQSKKLMMI